MCRILVIITLYFNIAYTHVLEEFVDENLSRVQGVNVGQDILELAVKQAKAFDAEVLVVTSLIGGDKTKEKKISEAEENLEQAKRYFTDRGVKNENSLLVRGSAPGEDIVSFAKENDVELIILGVKSRSKVGKLLFGSTAQYVILKADCPVLTLK